MNNIITSTPSLPADLVSELRAQLPRLAEQTVATVTQEVPEYAGALDGAMGGTIQDAVQVALAAFLRLAAQAEEADPSTPMRPALDGAYALGRGEARSGRTVESLLAAYRAGARVAWREMSTTAVDRGLEAASLARFAELVFAYIDQLSASSAAGHADELARSGRVREQYLERLGSALLDGATPDALRVAAERADWPVPETLTAVLVPAGRARAVVAAMPRMTLLLTHDVAGLDDHAVLLVPDVGAARSGILSALRGQPAVVGPTRPWASVRSSHLRAVRCLGLLRSDEPVDTEQQLTTLVLTADAEALEDLRTQALAPLAELRPAVTERLAETLRSWLLHQGRRDEIAAELLIHPQTVRYRMTQLRDLYGDRLTDPDQLLALTVALAGMDSRSFEHAHGDSRPE